MKQPSAFPYKVHRAIFVDDDEPTNILHEKLAEEFKLAKEVTFHLSAEMALVELSKILQVEDFPELIFVDLHMPDMDGHDFAKRVSMLDGFDAERTCIAVLTNSRDIKDVIKADEGAVECYYWKPLDANLLEQVLTEGFRK